MNANHNYQKVYPPTFLLLVICLFLASSTNAIDASQNLSAPTPTIHCQNETCDAYQMMKRHESSPEIQPSGCHYWRLKLRAQSINCERCDQCLRMKFYLYGSPSCYYCLRLKYLLSRSPSCHRCLRLKVLLHLNPSCQTSTCELCRRGISPEARCLGDSLPNPRHPLRRTSQHNKPERRRQTTPVTHHNHKHYHDLPGNGPEDDDIDFVPRHQSKEVHHHRHHLPKREEEDDMPKKRHYPVMHHHRHLHKPLPEKKNPPKTEPKKHKHLPKAQLEKHPMPKTKTRKHYHLHKHYSPPAPIPEDLAEDSAGPMSAPWSASESAKP